MASSANFIKSYRAWTHRGRNGSGLGRHSLADRTGRRPYKKRRPHTHVRVQVRARYEKQVSRRRCLASIQREHHEEVQESARTKLLSAAYSAPEGLSERVSVPHLLVTGPSSPRSRRYPPALLTPGEAVDEKRLELSKR